MKDAQVLAQKETDPDRNGVFDRITMVKTDMKYPYLRIRETIKPDPATSEEVILTREIAVADHIMVKLAEGVDEEQFKAVNRKYGAVILKKMGAPGMYLVRLRKPDVDALPEAIEDYRKELDVISTADPDYVSSALALIPNDAKFGSLWAMDQTSDCDIDAPEAWDFVTGSTNVVVAVIDTGIDYNHEDLAGNMWKNPGEIAGNGVDDDNNGYIDDVYGWDFNNDDNDPYDDSTTSHGTHCAGTIGAIGNNSKGVVGVCWNVRLMALKFLNSAGSGYTSDGIDAIYYATRMGADVTCNSWGGGGYSATLKAAIDDAGSSNILFVAAAGDTAGNNDVNPIYPASYDSSNIIAVAATDKDDGLASYSCYGASSVDLCAPGESVLSTVTAAKKYDRRSGTSAATPFVAGACALLKAYDSGLSALEIKQQILNFADPVASLAGKTVTGGRLSVLAMLPSLQVNNDEGASGITANSATLNGNVIDTGGEDPVVMFYWGETDGITNASTWNNNVNMGTRGKGSFSADIGGLVGGRTYYYRCYVYDSADQAWAPATASFIAGSVDLSITKTVDNPAPNPGDAIAYMLAVANAGPDTATGVEVTDLLPENVTFNSASASQGTYDNVSGLWAVGILHLNETAMLHINVTVTSGGVVTNTAAITAVDLNDSDAGNNSDSAVITAPYIFTVSGSPAEYGNPAPHGYGTHMVSHSAVITNSVTSPADVANGTRYVLSGWTGRGSVPSAGSTNSTSFTMNQDSTLTWNWVAEYWLDTTAGEHGAADMGDGWHATGSQATITALPDAGYCLAYWTGDVPEGNEISNPLTVTMDRARTITANFADTNEISHAVDLSVTKSVDNVTPNIGETVYFTITVTNLSTNVATGVEVTDLLEDGVTFISASASQGSYCSTSGVWTVGTLASGDSARLTINVNVLLSVNLAYSLVSPSYYWDSFGFSVSSVGENLFVVGARTDSQLGSSVGSAYLYDRSGTLLAHVPNPEPDAYDWFGYSVSGVGTTMFVVGASYDDVGGVYNAGSVYLYDTDGNLLTSIPNPGPGSKDEFGFSLCGVGNDMFVVGSPYDYAAGVCNAGSVYLYDTNGNLLASIPNPEPATPDNFGWSVSSVGSNMFLVGAKSDSPGGISRAGSVYLYNRSGTLLAHIPNPEPESSDYFGYSVSGIGNNMFVVGANYDDPGGVADAGSAYLYDTSGTLLATIPNPKSGSGDEFGHSVSGVGDDMFVISALGDNEDIGSAFLYHTSGTLLATMPNPEPSSVYDFGWAVSGLGSDMFLIGAPYLRDPYVYQIRRDNINTASLTGVDQRDIETGNNSGSALINAADSYSLAVGGSPAELGVSAPYAYGTHRLVPCTGITNVVTTDRIETNGTRYSFSGWTGNGSVPPSGDTNIVWFTLTQDSKLTWIWSTEYWLDTEAGPNGTVDLGDGWHTDGSQVTITATPDTGYFFVKWTGDVPEGSETGNPLTVTMDQPRSITANFNVAVDLSVTKTTDKAWPRIGESVTYTVEVRNAGTNTATGVELSDTLPDKITFGSATPSQGAYDSPSGIWTVGGLAPTARAVLTLNVTVDADAVANVAITNTAMLTDADQKDIDSGNDTSCALITVPYTLTVAASPAQHGSPLPHGYGSHAVVPGTTVTNTVTGPADEADGVRHVVSGWAGSGSVPLSGATNVVSFVMTSSSTLTWNWKPEYWLDTTAGSNGKVDAGDVWYLDGSQVAITATPDTNYYFIKWTGDVPEGSERDNPLTVTMDQPRSITANFGVGVDLSVTKAADKATPSVGESVTYTVEVRNVSENTATGVEVTDALPGGVTCSTSSASQGSYDSVSGAWTVGTLTANGSAKLTIGGTVGAPPITIGTNAIPNPVPSSDGYFGYSVAGVGTNMFAVGAYCDDPGGVANAGSVYVYDASGAFLACIPNPEPGRSDYFGCSVSGVGSNMFIVGAYGDAPDGVYSAGGAYLYDTNGTLLASIRNPTPVIYDCFGYSVSGVGSDMFIVGAFRDAPDGVYNAGSAYLYDTSGALLATLSNPEPASCDYFGYSASGVGSNKFVVGALYDDPCGVGDAGSVYLYDKSGTLLAMIPNPEPGGSDYFGYSVSGVGSDMFVVGAYGDHPGAIYSAGSLYLYDTGGTLLKTVRNPKQGSSDCFGYSVSGMKSDMFVVGAFRDDQGGVYDAGSAYLYDTSGTLLATIPNPQPGSSDYFGWSVAGVGDNRLVVGSHSDDPAGVKDAGSVYVYDLDTSRRVSNTATLTDLDQKDIDGGNDSSCALITVPYTLTVAGSPAEHGSPAAHGYGSHAVMPNAIVTNTVVSPADEANGARYVVGGWTGTGSVLADGSTNVVTFVITSDSTLTWMWEPEYRLDTEVTGQGSVDKADQWVAAGREVTVKATASDHYHFTHWTGDTNGCSVNGTEITAPMLGPRRIIANFAIDTHTLEIVSQHGTPDPGVGVYTNEYGSALTNRVGLTDTQGTTRYLCMGWTMTGNEPRVGAANEMSMTQTNDAVLTWNWKTQYELNAVAGANGYVATSNGWYNAGTSNVLVSATPLNGYHFVNWTGSVTNSVNPLSLTMDQAYTLTANFAINVYEISATADSGGTIVPGGVVQVVHGSSKDFAITPDEHYHVADVQVNGRSIGPSKAYTFTSVTSNQTIHAVFAVDTYALVICSEHGTPVPDGTNTHEHGSNVTCVVDSEVNSGSSRHICAGWTGEGSVPSSGSTNVVSFAMTQDSTLIWNWKTLYWLDTEVSAHGSVDRPDQWVDAGSDVAIKATASDHYHFTHWTGDTNGCVMNGAEITAPMHGSRQITANFAIDTHTLQIVSEHGAPEPGGGVYTNEYGTDLTNRVGLTDTQGTTQYVCTGWTMTGNEPVAGTTNLMSMTHTNDAVLTWSWKTQYALNASAGANGYVTVSNGWYEAGTSNVMVSATPSNGYHFANWTGSIFSNANPLTLTMDRAYTLTANFAIKVYEISATAGSGGTIAPVGILQVAHGADRDFAITADEHCHIVDVQVNGRSIGPTSAYTFTNVTSNQTIQAVFAMDTFELVVGSEHGTPAPVGTNTHEHGSNVTCVVDSEVNAGSMRYVCTGWTGEGSVPSSGSTNVVSFAMTQDSALIWNWEKEYWLDTGAGANGTVDIGDGWHLDGSQVTITALPDEDCYFVNWTGDVPEGSETGNPLTLTMDQPRSITANFGVGVDLSVSKYVDNAVPHVGDTVTYGIIVTNMSANTATGVELTDVLPDGAIFNSASASQGAYDNVSGAWDVGTLAPGASAKLAINATVHLSVVLADLIHSSTNAWDELGYPVSSIGDNLFVVGAPADDRAFPCAGSVYLYDTNGTLLASIPNPEPAENDSFGCSVSGVGSNMFVVGADSDDPGGVSNAGSVYLYDTSGTLLASIPNPEPESDDEFGAAVSGVGSDMFVISAPGDSSDVGSVYLYDTSGTLLAAMSNPEPSSVYDFGWSVAGVGSDMFLVGASRTGTSYLYEIRRAFTNTASLTEVDQKDLATDNNSDSVIVAIGSSAKVQFSPSTYSVNEDAGTVTLTVTRTGNSSGEVSVDYSTSDGTASAGSDYTSRYGTLSWPDGDTSIKTITIFITDDSLDEDDETFTVTLSNPSGAGLGSPSSATVTIGDNDEPPESGTVQFNPSSYSVNENAGTVTLTVTRTGGSYGPASVDYSTADGTASAGSDYTSASGTLSWSDGDSSSKTITLTIMDDSLDEADETFTVTLSNPSGVSLGSPSTATVTITDNEEPGEADLEVSNLKFVPVNLWAGDHPAMISFELANDGPDDMESSETQTEISFYLSSNTTFGDGDDIAIGTMTEDITLSAGSRTTIRDPGRAHNADVTIPEGISGDYYVFVSVRHVSSSGSCFSDADGAYAMRDGPINVRIHPSDQDEDGDGTDENSGHAKAVNDYDGDGKSDLAVYQDASGYWYILLSASGTIASQKFGASGYAPVPGDYDGDGKTDLAVYHEASGYWYVLPSSTYSLGYQKFGEPGYEPVSGDFDGDGKTDLTVYHEASGYWFVLPSSTYSLAYQKFGELGYTPVSGDFDGDGKSDLAVYHEDSGYWYILPSASYSLAYMKFGETGYEPVSGDFDGDGKSDLAVYHEASGYWYVLSSESGTVSCEKLGGMGYEPVPGDYDGDGITDIVVYYEASGYWNVLFSPTSVKSSVQFGGPGYVPVGVFR